MANQSMTPDHITFTGVGHQTSIQAMAELSRQYPFEWAMLFSPKRQGNDPRYPDLATMQKLLLHPDRHGLRMAAHLCGDYSPEIMAGTIN